MKHCASWCLCSRRPGWIGATRERGASERDGRSMDDPSTSARAATAGKRCRHGAEPWLLSLLSVRCRSWGRSVRLATCAVVLWAGGRAGLDAVRPRRRGVAYPIGKFCTRASRSARRECMCAVPTRYSRTHAYRRVCFGRGTHRLAESSRGRFGSCNCNRTRDVDAGRAIKTYYR